MHNTGMQKRRSAGPARRLRAVPDRNNDHEDHLMPHGRPLCGCNRLCRLFKGGAKDGIREHI